MADLFSPLTIAGKELPNRIVMASSPSGFACADGFVGGDLIDYYVRRARGGVGLILSEPLLVAPPPADAGIVHLGIYADAFVTGLCRLVAAVRENGARVILSLASPLAADDFDGAALLAARDSFILGAWRAHCAGADGVLLSSADGGVIHALVSSARNHRLDAYGGGVAGRLRFPLEVVEGVHAWIGPRMIIAFRLAAEELIPGGMSLQDARLIAKRVISAGVRLIDVTVSADDSTALARFPGWAVPLANGIKRVTPEIPVIGFGLHGDYQLADSIIRDGSVDLVAVDHTLRADPDWPRRARKGLGSGSR
jgi:2,4-dienoyl-CoA reductase-like NADH-dependent reductase (Old Yellow Enzyme family)